MSYIVLFALSLWMGIGSPINDTVHTQMQTTTTTSATTTSPSR